MAAVPASPSLVSFLLLFVLISSSPAPVSSGRCNKEDKRALFAIKAAMGNPYDLASWVRNISCCDWYGIECDETTGRVVKLAISGDSQDPLSGTISPAVGDLPFLLALEFHNLPNLTGTIPAQVAKLKRLRDLMIRQTSVYGPVPSFLSELPALEQLDLSFNRLSGSIPPSLGGLPRLSIIDLSRNHLTGLIPDSLLRTYPEPPILFLSHNNLTGEIPRSFGSIDFFMIDVSRNQLTGDASFLFGKSKQAANRIVLSRNRFEFDLSGVEFPEGIYVLDINHNKIFGSIPDQITKVTNLQSFNASYNRLCGRIPTGGSMNRFDASSYIHNKCLCGPPLPTCQ